MDVTECQYSCAIAALAALSDDQEVTLNRRAADAIMHETGAALRQRDRAVQALQACRDRLWMINTTVLPACVEDSVEELMFIIGAALGEERDHSLQGAD